MFGKKKKEDFRKVDFDVDDQDVESEEDMQEESEEEDTPSVSKEIKAEVVGKKENKKQEIQEPAEPNATEIMDMIQAHQRRIDELLVYFRQRFKV